MYELEQIITIGIIILIAYYLLTCYPFYIMAIRANLKNPWIMWIPILKELKFLHLAGFSYWYILLTFIPCVNVIFLIILYYKVMQNFSLGLFGTIMGILFSFIVSYYIVFRDKKFIGTIPSKFKNLKSN